MTDQQPSRRRRNPAMSPDELHRRYPSLNQLATRPPEQNLERAWVAVFNARPDAMYALLADFIKQVHARPGRIGQRPMPKEAEVDLEGLIYGEDNDLPLIELLPKMMGTSERTFCQRIYMSRAQFRRMMAGEYHPDVYELRRIAVELRKPPVFFVEYRKAMALAAVVNLFNERPGVATKLYRSYLHDRLEHA
jgi:hypothetical protein